MNKPLSSLLLTLILGTSLPMLSGCFPIVAAGVATGALSVSDRRSTGMQVEDQNIELKANGRIRDAFPQASGVAVVSYNRRVLVYGQAPDAATKSKIADSLRAVPNVREVINEIDVGAATGLRTVSTDAIITTRVKASFIDAKDLQANSIKVVTERGVVYLLGLLTEREAKRAAEIAAGVSGVSKVVKVFEVISEAQLAEMPQSGQKK